MNKLDQISILKDILLSNNDSINKLTIPNNDIGAYEQTSYPGVGSVLDIDFSVYERELKSFLNSEHSSEQE
jgi:polyisoprenyl-teichoic acid--peptidoglycan teichoic acid transferase